MTGHAVERTVAGHPLCTDQAVVRGISVRPVTGSDAHAMASMWQRCALTTRIARFHAPVRTIPVSYLTAVFADPSASVVAACQHCGAVVALASLIPDASRHSAELGVLVEDAWQRAGIGRRLVAHLISTAHARGITTLTASVLADNAKVANLLRQIPGEFSLAFDGPVLKVQIRLASLKTGTPRGAAQPPRAGPLTGTWPPRRL
jgi:GNAT superfamily N-acetyltransferase